MKVELQVPFEEKFEAQSLGAKWDPARRVWFVPDGFDAVKFLRWMPRVKLNKKVRRVLRMPV